MICQGTMEGLACGTGCVTKHICVRIVDKEPWVRLHLVHCGSKVSRTLQREVVQLLQPLQRKDDGSLHHPCYLPVRWPLPVKHNLTLVLLLCSDSSYPALTLRDRAL